MLNLIRRNTPDIADKFTLELTDKISGKSYYEVSALDGRVHIKGDCKISQAMGYYVNLPLISGPYAIALKAQLSQIFFTSLQVPFLYSSILNGEP